MEGDQLAYKLVGLLCLNIDDSLVVDLLPLNHLTMMNSCCQQDRVHNLTQDELDDLVLKLFRNDRYRTDPGYDVNEVSDQVVPEQHITHHEDQGDRQLNLQLVEAGDGPSSQVLGLVGEEDEQDDDAVEVLGVRPQEYVLELWVVQLIDQQELKDKDRKHDVELVRELPIDDLELTQHVTDDDDLVQQNEQSKVRGGLASLTLRDEEQELALVVLKLELQQVSRSFDEVVDLVLGGRLHNYTIIKMIKVIVEAEHIHGSRVKLVGLVALVLEVAVLHFPLLLFVMEERPVGLIPTQYTIIVSTTVLHKVITLLVLVVEIVVVQGLVALGIGLHLFDEDLGLWTNINVNIICITRYQLLHKSRPLILSLPHALLLELTHNKDLLLGIEVLDPRLPRRKLIVVCIELQEVLCLLAHNHFVWWSSHANSPGLLHSLASESELGLDLTNDGGVDGTSVDSDVHLEGHRVFEVDVLGVVQDLCCEVSDSH